MRSSEERAVRLTNFLITLPPARMSFLYCIAFGFFFGLLSALAQGKFDFVSVLEGGGAGLFLVSVPAVLSALTTMAFKRELTLRRVMFLAFVCSVIYSVFYLAFILLSPYSLPLIGDGRNLIYIAFGVVFVTWVVIAKLVFGLEYAGFVFALIQLFYNAAFLLANRSISVGSDPTGLLLRVYFSALAFLAATYAVFVLLDAPMKRAFGVSGTKAIRLFLAQWLKQSKEIEEVFENVGEEVKTLNAVMAFKAKGKIKALFVVPYVHFGPFGNLGGSEFPQIIGAALARRYNAPAFIFHATATHDFNPVRSSDSRRIIEETQKQVSSLRFSRAFGGFSVGKSGASKAYSLEVNKDRFIALTRAPKTTEDIDFSLGMALMNHARALGARQAIVADAHNCETGEIMRIESGNPIGFEYIEAIGNSFKAGKRGAVSAGFSSKDFPEIGAEGGIGGNGLKCAVFSSAGKKFALLLFDSNGITPGFRREVLDEARRLGFPSCEVMTTDTHAVNSVSGVLNPVGRKGQEIILRKARQALAEADSAREPIEAGASVKEMQLEVLGVKSSSELMGTLNAMIAILRILVPLIIIGTVAFVLWGIAKI